jgi:hypothetical protein
MRLFTFLSLLVLPAFFVFGAIRSAFDEGPYAARGTASFIAMLGLYIAVFAISYRLQRRSDRKAVLPPMDSYRPRWAGRVTL